jgi:glycerophosphoryl diester phosphodiesterase
MAGVTTLPIRPPIIVHHMAALDGSPHPPNSLEAIHACLDAGAAVIEIDATALAEGDYLLVHDPLLEAETTGAGEVGACTPAQSRDLRFVVNDIPTNTRVPQLSEVVAALMAHPHPARLQIDFKNMIPFADDEPLRRLIALIEPLGERVIVSSGADWQLRKLRRLAPCLDLGFDVQFYIDWQPAGEPRDPREYPKTLGAYGYYDDHPLASQRFWPTADYLRDRCGALIGLVPRASTFYISHTLIAQSLDDGFNWAEMLHEFGIQLDAWTMDAGNAAAERNASRLLHAGVDLFTTNTPHTMSKMLNA